MDPKEQMHWQFWSNLGHVQRQLYTMEVQVCCP